MGEQINEDLRVFIKEKWGKLFDPNMPKEELIANFDKYKGDLYNDLLTMLAIMKKQDEIGGQNNE